MQYLIDHPAMLRSLTLIAPVSPYGFSGTKDERGTPCRPDYAGSGAGGVNPEFPKLVQEKTREGGENPMLPQTRVVLERYKSRGGKYREAIFENCAHAPYIEKQDEFVKLFLSHLKERDDALL